MQYEVVLPADSTVTEQEAQLPYRTCYLFINISVYV